MQSVAMTDKFRLKLQDHKSKINKETRLLADLEEKAATYRTVISTQDYKKIEKFDNQQKIEFSLKDTKISELNKASDELHWRKVE